MGEGTRLQAGPRSPGAASAKPRRARSLAALLVDETAAASSPLPRKLEPLIPTQSSCSRVVLRPTQADGELRAVHSRARIARVRVDLVVILPDP